MGLRVVRGGNVSEGIEHLLTRIGNAGADRYGEEFNGTLGDELPEMESRNTRSIARFTSGKTVGLSRTTPSPKILQQFIFMGPIVYY